MKSEIIEKLSRELDKDIDSEPKVLYFLAEIRKCIDGYDQANRNQYPNLYFYCNWVLHIRMDRTPAEKLLNRFESVLSNSKDLKTISRNFIKQEKDFYTFVNLKKELEVFLRTNGLPTGLVESGGRWFKFKKLLVGILADCPLVNESGKVSKFSYETGEDDQIRFRVGIRQTKRIGSFKVTLKEK